MTQPELIFCLVAAFSAVVMVETANIIRHYLNWRRLDKMRRDTDANR